MSANDSEPATRRSPKRGKRAGGRTSAATLEPRAREASDMAPSAELSAEPSEETPAVVLPEDRREEVWTLHLRGVSQRQIAKRLDLHRDTVGRLLNECYREFGKERRARLRRKLDAAVASLQSVKEQAWADHDTDNEREQAFLTAAVPGTRYQSQRASYLRLALDAEKEIARLEGLYAEDVSELTAVLFSVERVVAGVVTKTSRSTPRIVEGDVTDA